MGLSPVFQLFRSKKNELNSVQVNGVHYSGRVPKVQSSSKKRTPQRPERHSRDSIIEEAIALLDEAGLPDLTMRRLAARLGVQPSALYWHFTDKQTLLAAVAHQILTEDARSGTVSTTQDTAGAPTTPSTADAPWEDAMRVAASTIRERLLAHRDGAEVVSSSTALGLVSLPLAAMLFDPLTRAGADVATVDVAARTLGHFILGHGFHQQQRAAALNAGIEVRDQADPDATFTAGLDLVVAGTAVRIAADSRD